MNIYTERTTDIPANTPVELAFPGSVFSVFEASAPFEVAYDDGDWSEMSEAKSVAGPEDGFDRVRVRGVDGGALTLHWAISVGTVRSFAVTVGAGVSVDNFPAIQTVDGTVNVGNLPAVQAVSDGGGSITVDGTVSDGLTEITRHGHGQVGASTASAVLSTTASVLLAPASNTAGCIVRTMSVDSSYADTTRITTGTAAPSAIGDLTAPVLAIGERYGNASESGPIFIPAGHGLWGIASAPNSYPSNVTFDLL